MLIIIKAPVISVKPLKYLKLYVTDSERPACKPLNIALIVAISWAIYAVLNWNCYWYAFNEISIMPVHIITVMMRYY